ncbi:MAG TPA: 50S ribosomal protein L2 [Candidatus Altiarchaeales archaeon]|nr:50S ribosomal protein L2 [Candidatus Altiarchaeales archaeon]
MGKRLITQRRGSGNPRYRALTHKAAGRVEYPKTEKPVNGQVEEFINDSVRTAPLAKIILEDFTKILMIAPSNLSKGDWIQIGGEGEPQPGNIMMLGNIKEGSPVFNIETEPGRGGKLVRASGTAAYVIAHEKETNTTQLKLPSKKMVKLKSNCMATVGFVAGAGRVDKPFTRAGHKHYAKKTRRKLYPTVRGRAMNAVDHPYGGGRHPHVGRPTTTSRNAPPGRKVGHIAAKRTGLKKRK